MTRVNKQFTGADPAPLLLQLFAEGGGDGGATAGAGGQTTGVSAGVPGLQTRADDLSDVQYGKQQAPAAAEQTAPTDRQAEFERLIKTDYKDLYDKRVQDTVQRRLKGTKETVDAYNALAPTLDMLYSKYGVKPGNVAGLNSAIEEDRSFYEEEALEKGISVEDLKAIKKMERENAQLKAQIEAKERDAQVEQTMAKWLDEAQEAAKVFPGFDLNTEIANPDFAKLLQTGVDVQTAYFAVHHRELVPQAMQYAAKDAEKKLANKMATNASRPTENGTHAQSPVLTKADVDSLTREDRDEIRRRVARGDKIVF